MTANEYEKFRKTLISSIESFNENEIDSLQQEQSKLLAAFDTKHNIKKKKSEIIIGNFILPLYKAAIIVAILLSTFFMMGWKASVEMQNRATIFVTDTIFKEVLVPNGIWLADSSTRANYFKPSNSKEINEIKEAVRKIHIPKHEVINESNIVDYETARRLSIAPNIDIANLRRKPKRGKSLHKDSVLSKMIVAIN